MCPTELRVRVVEITLPGGVTLSDVFDYSFGDRPPMIALERIFCDHEFPPCLGLGVQRLSSLAANSLSARVRASRHDDPDADARLGAVGYYRVYLLCWAR